ncbi:unnamed protein product [Blepharisma stoltei]|uniref:Uncharacterized protein n=1 Tax=Blepharisma stoltei TaxID=1481888 RepID=A0AAU9I590_9CILI|nr:unnamed protein product [Blepharisma stoltei]
MEITKFIILLFTFAFASDVIGEAYSEELKSKSTSAITYKLASVAGYTIQDLSGWISPRIVSELTLDSQDASITGSADVIPSESQYYDGSSNLHASSLRCRLLVSIKTCTALPSCGWCGSSNICIPGSLEGPLYPCELGHYTYTYNI